MLTKTGKENVTTGASVSKKSKEDLFLVIEKFFNQAPASEHCEAIGELVNEFLNTDGEDKEFTGNYVADTVFNAQRIQLFIQKLQESWTKYKLFNQGGNHVS